MQTSRTKPLLFCPIRQKEVVGRPEEQVRQRVISQLLAKGYPLAYMQVEPPCRMGLQRRGDLLVSTKSPKGTLTPLFLIECKAGQLRKPHFYQLVGYNQFVHAPFVGLTNGEIWHLYSSWTGTIMIPSPPSYAALSTFVQQVKE